MEIPGCHEDLTKFRYSTDFLGQNSKNNYYNCFICTSHRNGAIQTAFTHEFHRQHIERVCNEALDKASLRMEDIDAIAVTNRPG